jgi:hypothetical protein
MEDGAKDARSGLTIKVIANFHVPGDYNHRKDHLKSLDAEVARLLGAALSNPSERIACLSMIIAEKAIQSAVRIARMDEDEIRREAEEISRVLKAAIEKLQQEGPPHSFSEN